MKRTFSQWEIYRVPFLISAITFAGLLFALLGDGVWDTASWILLAAPLVLIAASLLRQKFE